MIRLAPPLLVLVLLLAAAAAAQDDPPPSLTLRQLVGQRMIYAYDGTRPPAELERRIARGEAAGVILFRHNIASRAELRATMARLQAIRRPAGLRAPLLVMIDQEGGVVKRLSGAPSRSPAQLGRRNSAVLARAEGRATARNLLGVGVNVNLAPVMDVGRPGSFQQRTGRSYSSDPARVARLGSAFVRGLQEGGVAATLKHFPGVGTIARNEDDVAQRVGLSPAALRRLDESPFAAGARAGARLVMTATAIYPRLSSRPAMLSPRISTGELRSRAGFTGVSITDDLAVVAMRPYGGLARLGRLATQAGNDLLLYCSSFAPAARAADALAADARAGHLSVPAMRESVRRVLELRAGLPG